MAEDPVDLGSVRCVVKASLGATVVRTAVFPILLVTVGTPAAVSSGNAPVLVALAVGLAMGVVCFLIPLPFYLLRRDVLILNERGFRTLGAHAGRSAVPYSDVLAVVAIKLQRQPNSVENYEFYYGPARPARITSALAKTDPKAVDQVLDTALAAARSIAVANLNAGDVYVSPLGPTIDKAKITLNYGKGKTFALREVDGIDESGLVMASTGKTVGINQKPGFDLVLADLLPRLKKLKANRE